MTSTPPLREPDRIIAGDTVKWRRSVPDYLPASGWTLTYVFVVDGVQISIDGTDNGDGTHLISVAAATSAAWSAGEYKWQAHVSKAAERYTVARGTVTIEADFEAATGGLDARSHVKKVLDALEATILGKADKDQLSYTIAGRSLERMKPEEITKWRDDYRREYRAELNAEKLADGRSTSGRLGVRFNGTP